MPTGDQIPLASIATLDFQRNYVRIQRINGLRTLSVFGDVHASQVSSTEILNQFKKDLAPELKKEIPRTAF